MKKYLILLVIIIFIAIVFWLNSIKKNTAPAENIQNKQILQNTNMEITSKVFANNQMIPTKYSCNGENISPPLSFQNVPKVTKSLALIVDDPDAPSGTWVHWLVWNIDPDVSGIDENSTPSQAVIGTASSGNTKYQGPCPPSGTHRYFFKLYALDTSLSLDSKAKKLDLEQAMQGHILTKSELVGLYKR